MTRAGDRAIVHHRLARHGDVDDATHTRVGADDHVFDVVPLPVVDDRMQLARRGVALRVSGERAGSVPSKFV
jgi:hypothetical protein